MHDIMTKKIPWHEKSWSAIKIRDQKSNENCFVIKLSAYTHLPCGLIHKYFMPTNKYYLKTCLKTFIRAFSCFFNKHLCVSTKKTGICIRNFGINNGLCFTVWILYPFYNLHSTYRYFLRHSFFPLPFRFRTVIYRCHSWHDATLRLA